MTAPALVLIAAPADALRYSLRTLLAGLPQIDSVQSIDNTCSLLSILTTAQPKLMVLDVNLPGSQAQTTLQLIKALAPRTHIVVFVDFIEQQQALLATSADLVLLKGYPAAELFANIERLLAQDDPSAG
jgi:DNA-binding NarL/FixJ family response regulator